MQTNSVTRSSLLARTTAYPCPPVSTKERCGDICGLDCSLAFLMSPDLTYSRQDRTPCRRSMFSIGWGSWSRGLCPTQRGRSGSSLGNLYWLASHPPGAEMEPVTKARPTGSNFLGGRDLAERPAQKEWRWPATVAKPVIPCSLTKS